jgi:predicted XRE-type DNA-binding protein
MPEHVVQSSGNVFADLGLEDAEDLKSKAVIAGQISSLIRDITGEQASDLHGLSEHEISVLENGKLREFSIEELQAVITKLDALDESMHTAFYNPVELVETIKNLVGDMEVDLDAPIEADVVIQSHKLTDADATAFATALEKPVVVSERAAKSAQSFAARVVRPNPSK